MNNEFGIYDRSYTLMSRIFQVFPEIEKAKIFGSRAMGNFKKGSDIDIVVYGENINYDTISQLHTMLNEGLSIPYFIDIIHYETINNADLTKHIDTFAKEILPIAA